MSEEYITSDLRILVVNDIYTRKTSLVPTPDVVDTCNQMVNVPKTYRSEIELASECEDGPAALPIGGFMSLPSAVEYLVRSAKDESVLGEQNSSSLKLLAKELGLDSHGAQLSTEACREYLTQFTRGNATYLFVNGDLQGGSQQANVYKGQSVISIMNHLTPTVVALGNHEFDHNNHGLEKCIGNSTFPWLGENIRWDKPEKPLAGVGSCIIYDNIIDSKGKCIGKYRNVNMELIVSLLVRNEVMSVDASVDVYGEYMHLLEGFHGSTASFLKTVEAQGYHDPTSGHCSFVPYVQQAADHSLARQLKEVDEANHAFAREVLRQHNNEEDDDVDDDGKTSSFHIVRLGIFSVCTPFTPNLAYPSAGTVFYDSVSCAELMAKALRSVQCHYVVCSSHLSIHEDLILSTMEKQYREKSALISMNRLCPGAPDWTSDKFTATHSSDTLIDIIVGGHEHIPIITQPSSVLSPPPLVSPMHSEVDNYLETTYADNSATLSNSVSLHPKNMRFDARNGAQVLKCGQNAQYVAIVDLQLAFSPNDGVEYDDKALVDSLSSEDSILRTSTFTPSVSQSAFAPTFSKELFTQDLAARLHSATLAFPALDTLHRFNCILKSQFTSVQDPVVVSREHIAQLLNSNSVGGTSPTTERATIETIGRVRGTATRILPAPALFFQGHTALNGPRFCGAFLRALQRCYNQHGAARYNGATKANVRFVKTIFTRFTVRLIPNLSETKTPGGTFSTDSSYMHPASMTSSDENLSLTLRDSAALVPKETFFPAHQSTLRTINYFLSRMYTDLPLKVSMSDVLVKLSGPLDTRSEFTRTRGTSGCNLQNDALEAWTGVWSVPSSESNSNLAPIAPNPFDSVISRSCKEAEWSSLHREKLLKQDPIAQITLINGGFIRGDTLYPRETPITYDLLLEELPFPKVIVFAKILGRDLVDGVNEELFKFPKPAGSFPNFSKNVSVQFSETERAHNLIFPQWERRGDVTVTAEGLPSLEDGSSYVGTKRIPRKIIEFTINGIPIQPDSVYLLTTTQFIAWGGDGCASFLKAQFVPHQVPRKNGVIVSSVVYEYILNMHNDWKQAGKSDTPCYKPPFDERIKVIK